MSNLFKISKFPKVKQNVHDGLKNRTWTIISQDDPLQNVITETLY